MRAIVFRWNNIVFLAVGLLFIGWLINTPPGLLGKADAVGYAVCHQIDLRSFHLGERAMPLCARCSGMYLGAMLGLVYLAIAAPRRGGLPPRRVGIILALLVLAFAVDGINSFVSLFPGDMNAYTPQNWSRLLTGTGMGLVIAACLYPAFNQSAWREWRAEPALGSLRSFGVLALLALLLDLLVLTENPLVLYPLALISAAGVLVILTMSYGLLCLIAFRAENRYQNVVQLALPLVAGFGLAMVQIGLIDWLRYLVTGTWDGFHFG